MIDLHTVAKAAKLYAETMLVDPMDRLAGDDAVKQYLDQIYKPSDLDAMQFSRYLTERDIAMLAISSSYSYGYQNGLVEGIHSYDSKEDWTGDDQEDENND